MAKKYFAKSGVLSTKASIGGFDVNRMVEDVVEKTLNVPTFNSCCDDAETAEKPIRYNPEDGSIEQFNGEEWVSITGTQIAAVYPQAAQNDIPAAAGGAISVTNYLTTINTDAGGDSFTLASGTVIGQMKKILLVVDGGGNGTLNLVTGSGATTITFNDAGDFVILQWNGDEWVVLENSGTTIV
jgi:hypothetical protein